MATVTAAVHRGLDVAIDRHAAVTVIRRAVNSVNDLQDLVAQSASRRVRTGSILLVVHGCSRASCSTCRAVSSQRWPEASLR